MRSAADGPVAMNRRLLMLGSLALGIAAISAFVTMGGLRSKTSGASEGPATSSTSPVGSMLQQPNASTAKSTQPNRTAAAPKVGVPQSFVPSDSVTATLVTSPNNLMAISSQDKAWLARHGYPTLVEQEWSKQASLDELKAAAQINASYAALYGEQLWERDLYREGKAVLLDALAHGSLYAAEAIALRTLHDGKRPDGSNSALFEAGAWWLYSAQMGNYHASDAMMNYIGGLSTDNLGLAMTRSFEIAQEVDAVRASMGLPPASREVRPSFNEYLENRNRHEATVIPR